MENRRSQHERVLQIVRRAFDSQEEPETGHIVEDEELLACWQADLLGEEEHRGLIDHLATCPRCRRELADMIDSGVLELPEAKREDQAIVRQAFQTDPNEHAATTNARSHQYSPSWIRSVLAASVLLAIGGMIWFLSPRGPELMLARAERELEAGNAAAAMDAAEKVLETRTAAATRTTAKSVLQEAGYLAAKSHLNRKEFEQVTDIEDRVSRRAGPSPRLVNLKLQAERGMPTEFALDEEGLLTRQGYELNGQSFGKAGVEHDKTTDRLTKEYEAAVADHPGSAPLFLNRGQFLLKMGRYGEARECFERAIHAKESAREELLARLGLGMAAFELRQYEAALPEFEAAARLEPQNLAAQLDLGICLNRLGRPAEAAERFRIAQPLTTDDNLRQRIDSELAEIKSKESAK